MLSSDKNRIMVSLISTLIYGVTSLALIMAGGGGNSWVRGIEQSPGKTNYVRNLEKSPEEEKPPFQFPLKDHSVALPVLPNNKAFRSTASRRQATYDRVLAVSNRLLAEKTEEQKRMVVETGSRKMKATKNSSTRMPVLLTKSSKQDLKKSLPTKMPVLPKKSSKKDSKKNSSKPMPLILPPEPTETPEPTEVSSGSSCTSDLFVGTWDYADGCDGSAYRAVFSCDDHNNDTCTFTEKRIEDGIVDDACIWSGTFNASAMIYYDPWFKICNLGYGSNNIVVDKRTCVDNEENTPGFGLKAHFDLVGNETEIMSILFTNDDGVTYYNAGTPRQALEVHGIRHRNLQVMNLNERKNIIERIQRRLNCQDMIDDGSNLLESIGITNFLGDLETPKGIVELEKIINLGNTVIDLGPQFLDAIEMFFSTDCGGGFAALDDIGINFTGTSLEFLGDINLMDILDDVLLDIIGTAFGGIILPQKVCTDDKPIDQLGADKGVDACEFLSDFSTTDIWAMGISFGPGKSICIAFSIPTLTFAIAQKNVIPVLTLPLPTRRNRKLDGGAVSAPTAINRAVSTLKVTFVANVIVIAFIRTGISTPTRTELWDGMSDPSVKMINGNFRFGGAGNVGFGFGGAGYDLKGTIEFDGSFLFDADYDGDGLLGGDLIDMAFLIQGSVYPKFEVFQLFELNFAEVFKGFSADLYVVFSGEDTQILIGCNVELNLGGICKIAPEFEFLCDMFSADAVLTGTINLFANKGGVGIRLAGKGSLKFNPNDLYDWFLDLIDYPEDGYAIGAEISAQIGKNSVVCIRMIIEGLDLDKFCTPSNYGRGVGLIPGRVIDCPDTYTNNGLLCGRGSDDIYSPSILPDCPTGYTNNGATCGRGSDDIYSPSIVADCPPGYTNIGLFCSIWPDSYYAPSRVSDCPSGYTNTGFFCADTWDWFNTDFSCPGGYFLSGLRCYRDCNIGYTNMGETCYRSGSTLSSDSMTCPGGYFKSSITQRCGVNCPEGYTNTGEYCHRPVSTLGASYMTCPGGYFKTGLRCGLNCPTGYTNMGETCHRPVSTLDWSHMTCKDDEEKIGLRCFPGDGGACYDDFELDSGLCYKKCDTGYVGLGPMCWDLDDFGGAY